MIFYLLLGYGIFFDCYRILAISFIGFVPQLIDQFNYILKIIFTFFSVSIAFRIVMTLNEQSGHKMKKESLFTIIIRAYVFLSWWVSVLSIFSIYKTDTNEVGFYTYQINFITLLIILPIIIPLFIYASFRAIIFLKEIKNRSLLIRMIFFTLIYISLLIERFASIGMYLISPNTVEILTTGLFLLTLIACFAFAFTIKNPDYIESLSAYFSVKSIYIIKNDGLLLYEFDLQKEYYLDPFSSKKILLAGFISGLKSGLQEVLNLEESDYSINFSGLNLLFRNGKFVFGLLFISEYTPILSDKLNKFVNIFEQTFKNELENWSGRIDAFKLKKIQDWVFKIFR